MADPEVPRLRQFGRALAGSDLVPVGEMEQAVYVISLQTRDVVAKLETILDFGGRRLALADGPSPVVVVGAYHLHGVVAYEPSGEVLWQRKDLKKPQYIEPLPSGLIAVGMEDKPLHVLAADSGETLKTLRGIGRLFHNPYEELTLAEGKTNAVFGYETGRWARKWTVKIRSFAVLSAAFSPDSVLMSEAANVAEKSGGLVSCIDLEGEVRWTWEPPANTHVLELAWNQPAELWVGVLWSFQWGGPKTMLTWTNQGDVADSADIGEIEVSSFVADGQVLLTSDETALEVPTGRKIWSLKI